MAGRTRQAARIREQLARVQDDLKRVRANQRVLAEQVAHLSDVADDAETRHLVAQTPLADREWRVARTDRDRHAVLLDEARQEAEDLLAEQDRAAGTPLRPGGNDVTDTGSTQASDTDAGQTPAR